MCHRLCLAASITALLALTACGTCKTYEDCCSADLTQSDVLPAEVEIDGELIDVRASSNERCRNGIAHMRNKDWKAAIEELKAAVMKDETDHCAHYALGVAYEKDGDMTTALQHYKKANFHKGLANYGQAVRRLQAGG